MFFKITDYAQRLLDDMESLDWPERVMTMQRNWIGRSEGASVTFEIAETGDAVEVFTTPPDTLWGSRSSSCAEHPLVPKLAEAGGTESGAGAMLEALRRCPGHPRAGGQPRGHPPGCPRGESGEWREGPVFVAPYVLMEYGTGAVMGVPARPARLRVRARPRRVDPRSGPARGQAA